MLVKTIHFRMGDEVWETDYEVEESAVLPGYFHWFKRFGSDRECKHDDPIATYEEERRTFNRVGS